MFRYDIPDTTSSEAVADWVELYVVYTQDTLSRTQLSNYIEGSSGSEADSDFLVSVWSELATRLVLYGDSPPFKIEDELIYPETSIEKSPEYVACLIWSLEGNPNTASASSAVAGKYFERLSAEAARLYLNGNAIIYGFPSEQSIETLATELLREKYNYSPPTYRKDRNLDVIAWKFVHDNRPGKVILFMQCAAGKDWTTKTKELNMRAWNKYIHFAAEPIRAFSMPVLITDAERWLEYSYDGGVLMDRARLYGFINNKILEDISLSSTLLEWCNSRIDEITSL